MIRFGWWLKASPDNKTTLNDFYDATNSKETEWKWKTNWKSEEVLSSWYGVDFEDGVTSIKLHGNDLTYVKTDFAPLKALRNLSTLKVLNLGSNNFSGVELSAFCDIISLEVLNLESCCIGGTFTELIGKLTLLKELNLRNNELKGSVPMGIGNLVKLTKLYLMDNELNGTLLDQGMGDLTELTHLYLSCNSFSGELPREWGKMEKLKYLDISTNRKCLEGGGFSGFSGGIPATYGNLRKMELFNFSMNNISGSFPDSCAGWSLRLTLDMTQLLPGEGNNPDFDRNSLCNPIWTAKPGPSPQRSSRLSNPFELPDNKAILNDFYDATNSKEKKWKWKTNWKSKEVLSSWYGVDFEDGVTSIKLHGNDLTYVKTDFAPLKALRNLSTLKVLNLGSNNFRGVELSAFCDIISLEVLNLESCCIGGTFTELIGKLTLLKELNLRNNELKGSVPMGIGNLVKLTKLYLMDNELNGTLDNKGMGDLTELTHLYLRDNSFSGKLPREWGELKKLKYLDISTNRKCLEGGGFSGFSGEIPATYGNLREMELFNFSMNNISGSFPESCAGWSLRLTLDMTQLLPGEGNNPDFEKESILFPIWKAQPGNGPLPSIKTNLGRAFLCGTIFMGYFDLATDCYAAYIFWNQGRYWYFGFQLFFFQFPCVVLSWFEKEWKERLYVNLHVKLGLEAFACLENKRERPEYRTLRLFEAVIESCPSAMLLLVSVFSDEKSLNSVESSILLLSFFVSTIVVANTLYRYFQPYNVAGLSDSLRVLSNLAEIWFRLITFVAAFLACGYYGFFSLGFIFLFFSMFLRGITLYFGESEFNLATFFHWFVLCISDCEAEANSKRRRKTLIFSHVSSFVEFVMAMVCLYIVDAGDLATHRKALLLGLGIGCFVAKCYLFFDRQPKRKYLNSIVLAWEKEIVVNGEYCWRTCFPVVDKFPEVRDSFLQNQGGHQELVNLDMMERL